jgi:hypothetical protein
MLGSAMMQQGRLELGGLHEPDNPAQQWWLYRTFDSSDGGSGASQLHRWLRLALVSGRTR